MARPVATLFRDFQDDASDNAPISESVPEPSDQASRAAEEATTDATSGVEDGAVEDSSLLDDPEGIDSCEDESEAEMEDETEAETEAEAGPQSAAPGPSGNIQTRTCCGAILHSIKEQHKHAREAHNANDTGASAAHCRSLPPRRCTTLICPDLFL